MYRPSYRKYSKMLHRMLVLKTKTGVRRKTKKTISGNLHVKIIHICLFSAHIKLA